jgi:hypothetical protein
MKTYVTFGQIHTHNVHGKLFDKNCIAVIEKPTIEEGRQAAFEFFGNKFCFTYTDEEQVKKILHYFPRGLIEVE